MRIRTRWSALGWFVSSVLVSAALGCASGPRETVTILHWNDFHAQNRPFVDLSASGRPLVGGAARFAWVLDSLRATVENPLVLHAGDEFSGSAECTITRGESQIRLLNLLHPDALELGNHEFDYGVGRLLELLPRCEFTTLCGNLWDTRAGNRFGEPDVGAYRVFRVGKAKVAVIGSILPGFRHGADGGRVESLDPEVSVRKWAAAVADSADLTVLLSHMGYRADVRLAEELGSQYVDVIIGGHSHTVMEHPEVVNGVVIFQAGDRGRFVGKLALRVDLEKNSVASWEGELVPVRNPGREDARVAAYVDSLIDALNARYGLDEIVAHLRGDWIRERNRESNVGDWQADAFRQVAGTDVAFQNSYGIRKDLPEGPVRVRDFWEMNPFSNELVRFDVTGEELLQILEHNCKTRGEILQVSGLRYACDLSKPEGRRLLWARLADGSPIEKSRTYSVCTNDYVARNFYRYFGIPPRNRPIRRVGILDRDAFIRVAREQGTIEAKTDGRIEIHGLAETE